MVSVIASSVRKGNVIEKEGKLYLVITAENIHPGKGTPVTHLEMRRISDGVKTVERLPDRNGNEVWRETDQRGYPMLLETVPPFFPCRHMGGSPLPG